MDGPATTAILYYDGSLVTYAVDNTRYSSDSFFIFTGSDIAVNKRILYNGREAVIDYNLLTTDGREFPVIGIWVGFQG